MGSGTRNKGTVFLCDEIILDVQSKILTAVAILFELLCKCGVQTAHSFDLSSSPPPLCHPLHLQPLHFRNCDPAAIQYLDENPLNIRSMLTKETV